MVKPIKYISHLDIKQFKYFWNKQLVRVEVLITEIISKNNLQLVRPMTDSKIGDAKDQIWTPKILSYPYSAHQQRTEPMMKLFESEICSIKFMNKFAVVQ